MLDPTPSTPFILQRLRLPKNDASLLLEFLALTFCILIASYFNHDGFISSDSSSYLALAKSLIEGNGFYVSGYGYSGQEKDFFAIWPVGYPVLIALTGKLTGIPVFWSSKIVNIVLAAFSMLIFRRIFSANAHIYGLLFLFGASIVIYAYTWSESLFIFALLGYATACAYAIKKTEGWLTPVALMSIFSLLLFLSRYIGAFSIISTVFLGLYYVFKGRQAEKGIALFIAAIINIIIVAAYLHHNLTLTNNLTGIPRIPATESNLELLQQLTIAVISELIITIPYLFFRPEFFAIIIIQIACFVFFLRKKPAIHIIQARKYCIFSLSFLSIGMLYLASVIILRWITHFDDFFFRLFFPGSLLIFTAILRHIEINFTERFQQIAQALTAICSLTVVLILIEILHDPQQPTYNENIAKISQEYSVVGSGSVVAFGSMHLKYLREDILLWSPKSLPYDETKESWTDFLNRVGNRNLFLAYPEDELVQKNYDDSVTRLLEKQKGNPVTRFK